jgi:hypothetical protein
VLARQTRALRAADTRRVPASSSVKSLQIQTRIFDVSASPRVAIDVPAADDWASDHARCTLGCIVSRSRQSSVAGPKLTRNQARRTANAALSKPESYGVLASRRGRRRDGPTQAPPSGPTALDPQHEPGPPHRSHLSALHLAALRAWTCGSLIPEHSDNRIVDAAAEIGSARSGSRHPRRCRKENPIPPILSWVGTHLSRI